jgi:hypothetical protein
MPVFLKSIETAKQNKIASTFKFLILYSLFLFSFASAILLSSKSVAAQSIPSFTMQLTPPFPEYNSAHSTISSASATILGAIYKGNTAFRDSSKRDWGWPDRSFKTSDEAALEVSLSRLYGGIHYRQSVKDAYDQGKKIGNLVLSKLEARWDDFKNVGVINNDPGKEGSCWLS